MNTPTNPSQRARFAKRFGLAVPGFAAALAGCAVTPEPATAEATSAVTGELYDCTATCSVRMTDGTTYDFHYSFTLLGEDQNDANLACDSEGEDRYGGPLYGNHVASAIAYGLTCTPQPCSCGCGSGSGSGSGCCGCE